MIELSLSHVLVYLLRIVCDCSSSSDRGLWVLQNSCLNLIHVLSEYNMDVHSWMIALSVQICCPSLNIFQKGVATCPQKCHDNVFIASFGSFHQGSFSPNRLTVDIDGIFFLRLHSLMKQKLNCCFVASSCSVMKRRPHKLVFMIKIWPVVIYHLQHFLILLTQLIVVILERARKTEHIHISVSDGCADRILTVQDFIYFYKVVLLNSLVEYQSCSLNQILEIWILLLLILIGFHLIVFYH